MKSEMTDELTQQTAAIVRERMDGQAAGHGMDHVLRVLASARAIQSEAGGDLVIVELAWRYHGCVARPGGG